MNGINGNSLQLAVSLIRNLTTYVRLEITQALHNH